MASGELRRGGNHPTYINPNVANLHRGKTRQGASDVASRSLGQVEAYLTVREILAEASKGVPPKAVLWREFSGFGRFRFATLGFTVELTLRSTKSPSIPLYERGKILQLFQ